MLEKYFAASYAQAKAGFMATAKEKGFDLQAFINPAGLGVDGEVLSIDVAYSGPADAPALLVLTSGTHGAEGYCGSGCQIALMNDAALLRKAHVAGIGVLLVHALNPYGFSYGHRTNEENIDLNRNFCDFTAALPVNPHYDALHPYLIPASWPPGEDNARAIQEFIVTQGEQAYRDGMMKGQYAHADGLFYGGRAASWSNRSLREIFRQYGRPRNRIAWIDYHTGLGPYGHAEKIFVQANGPDYLRAREWWGRDVVAIFDSDSSTVDVRGTLVQAMLEECAAVPELTFLALEYGTAPLDEVFTALRADRWLANRPDVDPARRQALKAAHRAAFYPESDDWKGAVIGQSRATLLQTIYGLSA